MRISIRRLAIVLIAALTAAAATAAPAFAAPSGYGDDVELTNVTWLSASTFVASGIDFCDTVSGSQLAVSASSATGATTTTQTQTCSPGSINSWSATLTSPSGSWGSGPITIDETLKTTTGLGLASDTQQASAASGIVSDFGIDNATLDFAGGDDIWTGFYKCPAGTSDTLTLSAAEPSSGATGTAVKTVSCTGAFAPLSVTVLPDSFLLPFTDGNTNFTLYHGATEIVFVLEGTLDVGFVG